MTTAIEYVKGDATEPVGTGDKLIAHICNDQGAWGKGFVLAISKKLGQRPSRDYKQWYAHNQDPNNLQVCTSDRKRTWPHFALGNVQYVNVAYNIVIANMVAQSGLYAVQGTPPIRYDALKSCLTDIGVYACTYGCSIHMPKIGTGLAGGKWGRIAALIDQTILCRNVSVVVYELE